MYERRIGREREPQRALEISTVGYSCNYFIREFFIQRYKYKGKTPPPWSSVRARTGNS